MQYVVAFLPDHTPGSPLEIEVQDEARVGQMETLTHIWPEMRKRPTALPDQRYACAYNSGTAEEGAKLLLLLT